MPMALAAQKAVVAVTMMVAGLREPAEILVDKWGVPHIYARSERDVFFAQGFNAARDRLFQIDLWRRRGLGELAEALGAEYVEQDKAARLLLFRGDFEREWAAYGPGAQAIATAFAEGVNAYVDWLGRHPQATPLEFRLLGYQPARWEARDVVRIRSHGLTRNLLSEVARARSMCRAGGADGLAFDLVRFALQPPWTARAPEGLDPCLPEKAIEPFRLATADLKIGRQSLAAAAPSAGGEEEGSNNWAIAPSRSATGRAILASDPHRAYATPSLRYIAHLDAPGLSVVGAGEPFAPGVSIGQNGSIAFGLTIFSIDQEDLYVYEVNPANRNEYRYAGRWEPMRRQRETIRVKGAAAVQAELAFTRHGPVLYNDGKRAYALRSCWFEPGMSPYFGSIAYMRARSFEQFRGAVRRWGAPTVNHIYADVKGNIGWAPGGMAPVRKNWDGLLPAPGDGRYEWSGFWSGDDLPRAYNPARGYVATANEMNLPADYPYRERKLGFEWTNGSRRARIGEVLDGLAKVSIEDSMRLQTDVVSLPGRRLARLLEGAKGGGAESARALLRGWDGAERAESAQAALYEVWISRCLSPAYKLAVLPKAAADAIETVDVAAMLDALERPGARLPAARRDSLLLTTVAAAYREMEKLQGADPKAWRWGKLHYSEPPHVLAGAVDAATRAKLQPPPIPAGGGPYTPMQSNYRGGSLRLTHGASFRMVVDVGAWDNSRAINYPGQSGNPDDPHYRDLVGMWSRGEYFPLLYTRAAVEAAAEKRIVLRPAGGRR